MTEDSAATAEMTQFLSPKELHLQELKKVAGIEFVRDHADEVMPTLFKQVDGAIEAFTAGKMNQAELASFSAQAAYLIDQTCVNLTRYSKHFDASQLEPVRDLARENRERAVLLTISP